MSEILDGLWEAFSLIRSGDGEIFHIVGLSLFVSAVSVCVSGLLGFPAGIALGSAQFRGKSVVIYFTYTMMSLPPVIAGLTVFLLFMRRGPLGYLQLNYTVTAMIIAQVCLVTPIICGLTYNLVRDRAREVKQLGFTLGAGRLECFRLMLFEMRTGLAAALVSGFGRAISEVGAVMIVGGNIKGKTRVMTTYIAELKTMGDYGRAIAVGIILLFLAFLVNAVLYQFQRRTEQ